MPFRFHLASFVFAFCLASLGSCFGIEVQENAVEQGRYIYKLEATEPSQEHFLHETVFASQNIQTRATGEGDTSTVSGRSLDLLKSTFSTNCASSVPG